MASWHSGYADVDGIRLHYYRTGGPRPPVVLAHGFTDDGLCWTPVAQQLEQDYDLIMVDARGHGKSDAPEGGYDSLRQACDLAGVIAHLGLEHPAVLGHSMGAATALVLAGTSPDVPGAILLEDPPAWWMPGSRQPPREDWSARMREWIDGMKRKTRDELISEQRAQSPGWSDAELGPWADSKLRLSPRVLNRSGGEPLDWPPILRNVRCPALLITGDPSRGAIVTEEQAAVLHEFVPQLEVVRIAGAGHNIRRDRPEEYLRAVRSFLTGWAAERA